MKVRRIVALAGLAAVGLVAWRIFGPPAPHGAQLPTARSGIALRWGTARHGGAIDDNAPHTGDLRLVGRVVGATGPVAGATVTATTGEAAGSLANTPCSPDGTGATKLLDDGCRGAAARIESLVMAGDVEAPPISTTTTGPDGTFVLDGLPSEALSVRAEFESDIGLADGVVPAAEQGQPLEIRLDSGRWLDGWVIDEHDAPLPDATLTAVDLARSRFLRGNIAEDGTFRIGPLPADARVEVVATAIGRLPASELVRLRSLDDGPASDSVTLRLFKPCRIEGRVVRHDEGVANAIVLWGRDPRETAATTESDGRFVIDGLLPTSYELVARDRGDSGTASVRLSEGEGAGRIEIVLAPVGGIEGTILDADGRPLANATAMLSRNGTSALTDATGHYGFPLSFRELAASSSGPATTRDVARSPSSAIAPSRGWT